ncbi:hypothetical protein [Azospirillum endophyticum]
MTSPFVLRRVRPAAADGQYPQGVTGRVTGPAGDSFGEPVLAGPPTPPSGRPSPRTGGS